jgi:histidine triad (HIT) family protein
MSELNCIFCKIKNKEIPSYTIWEDDEHIAFLDAFPITKGQVLVIPKHHMDYIFDLGGEEYTRLFEKTKKVALMLQHSLNPKKVAIRVEGLEVPHVHVKLYPINSENDLVGKQYKATSEELEEVQKHIAGNSE